MNDGKEKDGGYEREGCWKDYNKDILTLPLLCLKDEAMKFNYSWRKMAS